MQLAVASDQYLLCGGDYFLRKLLLLLAVVVSVPEVNRVDLVVTFRGVDLAILLQHVELQLRFAGECSLGFAALALLEETLGEVLRYLY